MSLVGLLYIFKYGNWRSEFDPSLEIDFGSFQKKVTICSVFVKIMAGLNDSNDLCFLNYYC